MSDPIIKQDGESVRYKGSDYAPVKFSISLPKEEFTKLAKDVLHVNLCYFSKPLKRWFCPVSELMWINRQAETFYEEADMEEAGDELARLYQGK